MGAAQMLSATSQPSRDARSSAPAMPIFLNSGATMRSPWLTPATTPDGVQICTGVLVT